MSRSSSRRAALLAGWAGLLAAAAPSPAAAQEPYRLEVGLDMAYTRRSLGGSDAGVSVEGAVAPGLLVRAALWPWLAVGGRYNRAPHGLELRPGALGSGGGPLVPSGDMVVTTLEGALYPTWNVTPTWRLFGSVGLGWGSVVAPSILIGGKQGPAARLRRGVMLEAPVGLGVGWLFWPGWASLSYEAVAAPSFGSTGDAYGPDPFVNEQGQSAVLGPFPVFGVSTSHHLTLALAL